MALKAGYNGVKKSVLDKLLQMSGALIIKSLGTALSLSDAGELRVRNASDSHSGVVQPDGVTTFIEGGLLKAMASEYTKDLLYGSETITHPPAQLADYTLLHDIKDYDMIMIIAGFTTTNVLVMESWQIPADMLDSLETATSDTSKQFAFPINTGVSGGGQWIRVSKGSADNIIHCRYNGDVGVYQIYGIKF